MAAAELLQHFQLALCYHLVPDESKIPWYCLPERLALTGIFFEFVPVSSIFFKVCLNEYDLHCEAVSHYKRTQSLNVVFVLSLWPRLLVAQMTCRCCSSLATVVTVTSNPVISSAHFRAKPAICCFLTASFCTPYTNQARKTTLKLCSSRQLH